MFLRGFQKTWFHYANILAHFKTPTQKRQKKSLEKPDSFVRL